MSIQSKVIGYYQTRDGACPFQEWVKLLKNRQTQMRIDARLAPLRSGNPGDVKSVGSGVLELRIDHGPGHRSYFAMAGMNLVVLLCGGAKRTQTADIK
jgi:putative addiction module killer protein